VTAAMAAFFAIVVVASASSLAWAQAQPAFSLIGANVQKRANGVRAVHFRLTGIREDLEDYCRQF
jgi:hypothetical protein